MSCDQGGLFIEFSIRGLNYGENLSGKDSSAIRVIHRYSPETTLLKSKAGCGGRGFSLD